MKRLLLSLVLVATALSASAFSYERAREQALFLSDKMAYELNLTQEQYDMAYQINLDYFLSVSSHHDIYGTYWQYRDADLRYVLFDWQYSLFRTLDYFYQPLRWVRSAWYFPVYSRYSRTHFFFSRPGVYGSYRGGWRPGAYRRISPYASMRPRTAPGLRDRHYPGAGRGNARPGSLPYNGGRGNGHIGGQPNNGGRGNGHIGGQSQNGGRGNGNIGGQSQNGGRGNGNIGGQSNNGGRGNGNAATQPQGIGRGNSSLNNSRSVGGSNTGSSASGRSAGRRFGR